MFFLSHHYPITLTTNIFPQSLEFLEQTYLKKTISALVNTARLAPMSAIDIKQLIGWNQQIFLLPQNRLSLRV